METIMAMTTAGDTTDITTTYSGESQEQWTEADMQVQGSYQVNTQFGTYDVNLLHHHPSHMSMEMGQLQPRQQIHSEEHYHDNGIQEQYVVPNEPVQLGLAIRDDDYPNLADSSSPNDQYFLMGENPPSMHFDPVQGASTDYPSLADSSPPNDQHFPMGENPPSMHSVLVQGVSTDYASLADSSSSNNQHLPMEGNLPSMHFERIQEVSTPTGQFSLSNSYLPVGNDFHHHQQGFGEMAHHRQTLDPRLYRHGTYVREEQELGSEHFGPQVVVSSNGLQGVNDAMMNMDTVHQHFFHDSRRTNDVLNMPNMRQQLTSGSTRPTDLSVMPSLDTTNDTSPSLLHSTFNLLHRDHPFHLQAPPEADLQVMLSNCPQNGRFLEAMRVAKPILVSLGYPHG